MYINFVFFCILNLGKIIQIVSHHESDSDQSTESGRAVQPEKERGHKEQAQEQSSTESGRAVQPEKERGHKEVQPEKDLDQEYGDNFNDDNISVNTLTLEMEVLELIDRVTIYIRARPYCSS